MPKGYWCDELRRSLKPLVDEHILTGYCIRPSSAKRNRPHPRICFFATSFQHDALCIRLLHMFFPLFITFCVTNPLDDLPKPLLGGSRVFDMLQHTKIKEEVKNCSKCYRSCGKGAGAHERWVIAHNCPEELAARLFSVMGCFEIISAVRIRVTADN